MKLSSTSFADGSAIPAEFAFGEPDADSHVSLAPNRSPQLAWSDVPDGTRSLVLLCHDPDAPSRADDVNQEGRVVPADLPRVDFFHCVLVDIDPATRTLEAGRLSDGVTPRGKPAGAAGAGVGRAGLNDYTGWFQGDADMEGRYFGYDGPCPPWNDSIPHRYVFTLFAVDLDACPLRGEFTGADVRRVIEGHVLAQAAIAGTYSLNPDVSP